MREDLTRDASPAALIASSASTITSGNTVWCPIRGCTNKGRTIVWIPTASDELLCAHVVNPATAQRKPASNHLVMMRKKREGATANMIVLFWERPADLVECSGCKPNTAFQKRPTHRLLVESQGETRINSTALTFYTRTMVPIHNHLVLLYETWSFVLRMLIEDTLNLVRFEPVVIVAPSRFVPFSLD